MTPQPEVSRSTRDAIFGKPGNVSKHDVLTPWGIRVAVNDKIANRFMAACAEAKHRSNWTPHRIDGYNSRPIRDFIFTPSNHAYALAWDFFATPPGVVPPGGVWTPTNPFPLDSFGAAFEDFGFRLGAKFTHRTDTPHIEWCGGAPIGIPTTPQPTTPGEAMATGKYVECLLVYGKRPGKNGRWPFYAIHADGKIDNMNMPNGSGIRALELILKAMPSSPITSAKNHPDGNSSIILMAEDGATFTIQPGD